ncbi:hypothetical protein E0H75_07985 [Kribbella capetownensis]|uniref:Glycosyltransferase family 1 protein n=1 Tax=Kribbella capetownensis TaxID=1572659 RepID=A0A4V2M909_9ACTN|nr:hypothetical protein [Kribbella capetownensis]TCC53612.1 hypothetical protein E0H75_07985 [Kribbella capetownensis]
MICLLPHCAYLSETSRMLDLHRALTELGLEVRVATHGGPHERLLAEAGIAYDVLGPGLSPARAAAFVGSAVGLGDPRQSMYDDDEIRTYVAAEAEYFRAHGITIAVTGFTLTTLLSSRLAGVQVITEHAGSFVPPMFEHRLLPAPTHPVDPRLKHAPDWLARFLINRTPNRFPGYCSGFDRVAEELGVEGIPSLAALLLGDLSLVPEIPEVLGVSAAEVAAWTPGKGYRPGSQLRTVGPLFAQPNLPIPPEVHTFLDRPGPTIYLAMTSTPPDQVRQAVADLSRLDARILVAGTIHSLADLTTQVLANPTHRESAERIQKLYAAIDGPTEAARAIAQQL